MKTFYLQSSLALLALGLLISCESERDTNGSADNSSPRIKKHTRLVTPETNQKIVLGEEIQFEIGSTEDIDSVLLEYEGESQKFLAGTFNWDSKKLKTGRQRLRLTVYQDGNDETHYARLVVLSDVVPQKMRYQIVNTLNHDPMAYTQGLFFIGDTLVESTGRKGQSKITKLNPMTGEVYFTNSLSAQYFGEGSTAWKDKIIQLTWTSNIGFVYNSQLEQTGTFNYTHEGWGITTWRDTLIVSDGTEILHFWDPRDFSEIGTLQVYDNKGKVSDLNELEMIDGLLYANVYIEDKIVVIDPQTGKVIQEMEMDDLVEMAGSKDSEVLNGIAYKKATKQIFVTGKLWPKMFEIAFVPEV